MVVGIRGSGTRDDRYDSSAHRLLIPEFRLLSVSFAVSNDSEAPIPHEFLESPSGYFPNFPVIIQGNGEPWDIANAFLVTTLLKTSSYESRSFRGTADHLLDYLRFLEDEGLSYLYFPENDLLKVTYRYRQRLIDQIFSGELKRKTGSARMNAVVRFYKGIMDSGLVAKECFVHQPYEAVQLYLSIETNFGLTRLLKVESHNLAIRAPRAKTPAGYINDGGLLRPLTIQQQETLLKELLKSSREYQLIFYLALFTGARMQTICTIQVRHIWKDLDGNGDLRLPIGAGTGVDTKSGTNMTLLIPGWLVHDLKVYSRSNESQRRRGKSFYGETDENYLFLANTGCEFYTSKREILGRANPNVHQRASSYDRAFNSIREGANIRQYISDTLLPRIRERDENYQRFRFHDLRASFGMNLLEEEIPVRGTTGALDYVQQRMGHSSKEITLQYLNYKADLARKIDVQSRYEHGLFKYVNSAQKSVGDHS
ncbi:site-specific integrase [Pseudomonas sp. S37]|uniref:tyrosine-type recombinase/integrase n=1 Tax=Pseudomonas sp. S37 TaxID=2767449 RepID=UPI001F2076EE|nr:tyrosine-type recombinase/integrase [Pseudomonas sp. S37]MBK4992472.1 site-specific integrase [Pseudomonas sp. S37]